MKEIKIKIEELKEMIDDYEFTLEIYYSMIKKLKGGKENGE